jgi:hypothetical protein
MTTSLGLPHLASDDAGFITASIFLINGGIPGGFTIPT